MRVSQMVSPGYLSDNLPRDLSFVVGLILSAEPYVCVMMFLEFGGLLKAFLENT